MYNLDFSQKLKLIQISGEDSAVFLNSQLTQDIKTLDSKQARLFAYCSPKGRMTANGIIYKQQEKYYMLVDAGIEEGFTKKLSMYILRSKVKINILNSSRISYINNISKDKDSDNKEFLDTIQNFNNTNNLKTCYINWKENKYIYIYINDNSNVEESQLNEENILSLDEFIYDSIQMGMFFINANNTEEYVPQMLNFEKLGGVSFKKGCYPGQEIVARSQYLGKIKKTSIYAFTDTSIENSIDLLINLKIQIYINNELQSNLDEPKIIDFIYYENKLHFILCIRAEYINIEGFKLKLNSYNLKHRLYFKDTENNPL